MAPPIREQLRAAISRARACIAACVARHRDAHAAAVLYQQLSTLSDAELECRGIARGDLGRHVGNITRMID
jgi:hypothetical protein